MKHPNRFISYHIRDGYGCVVGCTTTLEAAQLMKHRFEISQQLNATGPLNTYHISRVKVRLPRRLARMLRNR